MAFNSVGLGPELITHRFGTFFQQGWPSKTTTFQERSSGYCCWGTPLMGSTSWKPGFPKAELCSVCERAQEQLRDCPEPQAARQTCRRRARLGPGHAAWRTGTDRDPCRPPRNSSPAFANLNKPQCRQLCVLGFERVLFFSEMLLCWNASNQLKLNNLP